MIAYQQKKLKKTLARKTRKRTGSYLVIKLTRRKQKKLKDSFSGGV